MTNYSRSVLKSNGLHRPKIRLKKFSFSLKIVPAYISKKLPSQRCSQPFLIAFSTSRTNGSRSLLQAKAGTHSPSPTGSHTSAYTAKQGLFQMRVVSLPSIRAARSRISPGRVSERQVLPLLGLGRVLPKNAESLRNSAALMRVAVPRRRGPAGLRDLFATW